MSCTGTPPPTEAALAAWIAAHPHSAQAVISARHLAELCFDYASWRWTGCGDQHDERAFAQEYALARLHPLPADFHPDMPFLAVTHERIRDLLVEFAQAREMLTSADTEHLLRAPFCADVPIFNQHAVDSYNAFVATEIPELVRREPDRVVVEEAYDLARELEALPTPVPDADVERLAKRYGVVAAETPDATLAVLRDLAALWPASKSHGQREHRLRGLAVRYGSATVVGGRFEGNPCTPRQAIDLCADLYGAPLLVELEYTVRDLEAPEHPVVHRSTFLKRFCYLPVATRSILCALHAATRAEHAVTGDDPDDGISVMIVSRGGRRTIVTQERAVCNTWFTGRREKSAGLEVWAECRSTRAKDLDGGTSISLSMLVPSSKGARDPGAYRACQGIYVKLLPIEEPQRLTVVLAALGMVSRDEITARVLEGVHDEAMRHQMRDDLQDTFDEALFLGATDPGTGRRPSDDEIVSMARDQLIAVAVSTKQWNERCRSGLTSTGLLAFGGGDGLAHLHYLLDEVVLTHVGWHHPSHPERKHSRADVYHRKACFLLEAVRHVLLVKNGWVEPSDRNSGALKRLTCVGALLSSQFRTLLHTCFGTLEREMRNAVSQHLPFFVRGVRVDCTQQLRSLLTDPRWCILIGDAGSRRARDKRGTQAGVSQTLDTLNRVAQVHHSRKVQVPLSGNAKFVQQREVRLKGYCIAATTENEKIGFVNEFAALTRITVATNDWPLLVFLNELGARAPDVFRPPAGDLDVVPTTPVHLNGDLVGCTCDPARLYEELVALRRSDAGYHDITLGPAVERCAVGAPFVPHAGTCTAHMRWLYDTRVVDAGTPLYCRLFRIHTDAGRVVEPYIVVDPVTRLPRFTHHDALALRTNPLLSLQHFVELGAIEYLNPLEADIACIATFPHDLVSSDLHRRMSYRFCRPTPDGDRLLHASHCMLHPGMLYGLVALTIPFIEKAPGARGLLATCLARQAIPSHDRTSLDAFVNSMRLCYPSRPLLETPGGTILSEDCFPMGVTLICAVMPTLGYGIEDSVVLAQHVVDSGLTSSVVSRVYDAEVGCGGASAVRKFAHPDAYVPAARRTRRSSYGALDANTGLPLRGARVDGDARDRSVVIGCVERVGGGGGGGGEERWRDVSVPMRFGEHGVVDAVRRTSLRTYGSESVHVMVRHMHHAELADKVSTREGQKATIGAFFQREDMPWLEDGTTVEMIVDPAFISSRMTANQPQDWVLGQAALLEGKPFRATVSTSDMELHRAEHVLRQWGFSPHGDHTVYCAYTGRQMPARILAGPTSIYLLRHLAECKANARDLGVRSILTQQPTEGKARRGGQRIGEMEVEALTAHGAGRGIRESMIALRNPSQVFVCTQCRRLALPGKGGNGLDGAFCPRCRTGDAVRSVPMQYTSALMMNEIEGLGYAVELTVETTDRPPYLPPRASRKRPADVKRAPTACKRRKQREQIQPRA